MESNIPPKELPTLPIPVRDGGQQLPTFILSSLALAARAPSEVTGIQEREAGVETLYIHSLNSYRPYMDMKEIGECFKESVGKYSLGQDGSRLPNVTRG